MKKMYKVLSPITKKDGTKFWMRLGSAFDNKDNSINVYLDAVPKTLEFQIRELEEADLRKRDDRANHAPSPNASTSAPDALPF